MARSKIRKRYATVKDPATGRQIQLHRLVAVQCLNRALRLGEVMHHVDGDYLNNRVENLMVFPSQAHHAWLEGVVCRGQPLLLPELINVEARRHVTWPQPCERRCV